MGALHPKQLHGSVGGSGIAIGSEIGEIRLYRQCSTGCGDRGPYLHYPCAIGPSPSSGDVEWWLGRVLWPVSGAWLSQTVPRSVKRLAKNRASFSEDDLCGVSAIRHGLCWGNENRGDTLIVPWRGRTRCLNAGPLASCGLTIGSRNNTRDRVAQPRLTRHRVDPIESFPKIYHMPCLGRVTGPSTLIWSSALSISGPSPPACVAHSRAHHDLAAIRQSPSRASERYMGPWGCLQRFRGS